MLKPATVLIVGALLASAVPSAVPVEASDRDWSSVIDNPYFPLPVGRTLIYAGVREGVKQIDRVHVTDRTRVISGVETTAVLDVARSPDGTLIERTTDWFAQDSYGTVWYFGEATIDAEGDTSGSWLAGVDGAKPGIVMEADPQVPDAYRQEDAPGAQDTAWVVRRGSSVRVPLGTLANTLVTLEATVVEPGVYDKKVYARGYGIVVERSLTGDEAAKLVRVIG